MEKYIKIRKIGEGAFGKANLVRHKQKNSQLVIKEINIIRMSAKEREESRKEVAVLAQLNHPNIVTYRESFEEHGNLYIVMDFCAGGDLYNKINTQRGILLSEDQILDWFVQMCLAIKHIHDRKILHRDIKSQNIFLTDRGMVQLGDFGIAKVLNSTVELARTCIGTPYYLSPEIVENKPYNNKSDIWSLGCVLYELTTLKHAFEAGNMKNLVLKIIRGSYPPVPPKYSYDIRNLIAQLFKRSPRDRPSINTILKKNFITQRVRKFLTEDELASEFSHTVMHGQKLARALPPPPKQDPGSRPSSAKRAPPKQGRYDPSAVYGAPFKKSRENRVSQEKKKKSGAGPNRPISSSFQDIQRKKQELIDKEKKRFEVQRKDADKRHKELIERQKMARINRSREEGWRNIVDNLGSEERKNENKDQGREQLRGPVPRVQPVEEKKPMKDRGNYDQYHSYLDKIQRDREERVRQPAGNVQAPVWRKAPNPIHDVAQQAQYDRRLGGEAAERARLVEDYIQRKQEAQKNKARGHAQMYGYTPPSTPVPPKPVVKPARVVGAQFRPPSAGRNREEQEYLEKLRQIRQNNYADRQVNQAMMKNAAADNSRPSSARDDADVRKKKIEALRQQADERAQKLKDQLELKRKDMLEKEKRMWERQQNKFAERPSSAKKGPDLKPVAAVPITGALQAIGAKPPSEDPALAQESEDKSSLQQQKECILKRLNEKGSPRGNWGDPKTLKEEPPGEEPESSRSRWGGAGGDGPSLAQLPLEETASHMEATSARDRVIKNPEDAAAQLRRQWGRPGSTVMNALKDAPISSTLGSLQSDDSFSSQSSKEASPQPNVQSPPVVPPVKEAVAYTITLSKDKIGKDTVTISPTKENPPEGIDSTSEKSENEEKEKTVIVDLKSEQSEKPLDKPNAKDRPGETSQTDTESESKISGSQSEKNTMQTDFKSPDIQNDTSNKVISPVANPETKNQSDDSISKKLPEDKPESDKKGDNEETESDRSGKPLTPPKPPRVSSKPEIAPKPRVISTTITLAKPVLLSKPETAMDFGSKLPSVGKSVGAGSLFNKVELDENVDEKIEELKANMKGVVLEDVEDEKERPKTVFKGLSTGHFDMGDTKLLRTCSEPDLTKLTVPKSDLVKSGVLSQSVGNMTEIGEEDGDCGDKTEEEGDESEVQSSPDSVGAEADVEEDEDEDLDELMSVRETMRSILLQGSDDESPKGTVQFSLSATEEEDKQDKDGDSAEKDIVKANKNSDGDKDNEDSDDDKDNKMNEKGDNSDNVTNKKEDGEGNKDEFQSTSLSWSVSIDDENRSVTTEENDDLDLFQTDDSDDHDEDDCDDFELYSRLEESRVELENQLGCTKFLKVYKTVQALQEDEDENIEEGARIAMELLGKEHEGLYPRIFQLVMADAAFTEDNE